MSNKKSTNKQSIKSKRFFSKLSPRFDERARFLAGIFIVFIGIFLLLSFISFFFSGEFDQSKILNIGLWELIRKDKNLIDNWTGPLGAYLSEYIINKGFGICSIFIAVYLIFSGLRIMKIIRLSLFSLFLYCALLLVAGSITVSFVCQKIFSDTFIIWGGDYGNFMRIFLENVIGSLGLFLLILVMIISVGIVMRKGIFYRYLITGKFKSPKKPKPVKAQKKSRRLSIVSFFKSIFARFRKKSNVQVENETTEYESQFGAPANSNSYFNNETDSAAGNGTTRTSESIQISDDFQVIVPSEDDSNDSDAEDQFVSGTVGSDSTEDDQFDDAEQVEDYDPTKDLSLYKSPTLDLLNMYGGQQLNVDMTEQNENKEKIISTLRNYGIEIVSITATIGPTVTLYEIIPQAGVRISKIRNLEDDIALSLAALGIRIIAPMPGKGTIGIEVPNKEPQIVSMKSILSSKKFQESNYHLPVAIGKTITNEIFMFDLCKMPHLLVAGATGQGKSVGLNAIITSLLYKKHPAELKMVLVDPKMVEFSIYSTIEKHYLAKLPNEEKAIITDVKKVTDTLKSLTIEMDQRYELLMKAHVRNISEYNAKFVKRRLNPQNGHRFLPYIVVIIDEFGDLIMTAGKEIEMPIARIAQKARAVGMHMIIATQRPTTNIITGTIKANFPARMAFRVTSQIDSRTILDMSGANQLVGRGDMLFSQGNEPIRIQCAFVDTPEIEEISKFIGKQVSYDSALILPEIPIETSDVLPGSTDMTDRDPLFEEAARLIVIHQQGSTSLIQRKFSIGYNRAGRLMDQLEAAKIVGPVQGSKPREVYILDEYQLDQLLDNMS